MTVLVDTNVIIDVAGDDPVWGSWSRSQLERIADSHILAVNPIVFAEVSAAYDRIEVVDRILPIERFRREPIPYQAAFVAGRAFGEYRRRGGRARSPLPDFFIGAHAAVAGHTLLTRDARRYRTYFPRLAIISPPGN